MFCGESITVVNNLSVETYLVVNIDPWWKPLESKYLNGELYIVVSHPMVNDDCGVVTHVEASVYHCTPVQSHLFIWILEIRKKHFF